MLDTELLKPKYLANNLFLRLVVYSILFDVVMLFIFHIKCPAYTKKILAWFIKQSIIPLGHYYVRGIMQAVQNVKLVFVQQLRHELWYEYCQA